MQSMREAVKARACQWCRSATWRCTHSEASTHPPVPAGMAQVQVQALAHKAHQARPWSAGYGDGDVQHQRRGTHRRQHMLMKWPIQFCRSTISSRSAHAEACTLEFQCHKCDIFAAGCIHTQGTSHVLTASYIHGTTSLFFTEAVLRTLLCVSRSK